MKRNVLSLMIGLIITTLACGLAAPATPAQPGVETIVAATFQALTSVAPATQTPREASGTTIAVNNISFVIPTGIGSGAQAEKIEAVPPSNDMPWWEIAPTYNKYLIQGYPLSNTFHKPIIYVYPVDEYIQVNQDVATLVDQLKTIINSPDQPLPKNLPFLPAFNAGQVFYSNTQAVNFQSGSGIRYLTQFDQAPAPINNNEVFYTFQGLTSDGKYYIAAILPTNTVTLVTDGNLNTVTPAGGIPFDWNPDNFEMLPKYIESVKQLLNATDPNAFTPSLPMLDTLIQSITVNSQ
jgi:hypothetical protein